MMNLLEMNWGIHQIIVGIKVKVIMQVVYLGNGILSLRMETYISILMEVRFTIRLTNSLKKGIILNH